MRYFKLMLVPVALVVAMFCISAASANAFLLSRVGPELTRANAKSETQALLRHDVGVQKFLGLNSAKAQEITVTKAQFFMCTVGESPLCPINTGKNGAGELEETKYRFGTTIPVVRVTFNYNGKQYNLTFEQLCSNLLSGKKLLKWELRRFRCPRLSLSSSSWWSTGRGNCQECLQRNGYGRKL